MPCLKDNVKSRVLQSDGTYLLRQRKKNEKKIHSQEWYIANQGVWHGQDSRVH
jgi:hypothetical protein